MTIQLISVDALADDNKIFKIPVRIVTPSAATTSLDMNASFTYVIIGIDFKTASGSLTLTLNIDAGSPVDVVFDGGAALAVGTTAINKVLSSAGTIAVGSELNAVVSGLTSTPTFLSFDLLCRRT